MPNRILRDCTDSIPVNALSDSAEKFFYRLIMKADDFGRFHGNTKLLRPILYPLQLDRVREADLDRLIAECVKASLVRLYEANGKRVIEIIKFGQRTRAQHSRFPGNDGHVTVTCQSDDGHMTAYTEPEPETETETEGGVGGVKSDKPPSKALPQPRAAGKARRAGAVVESFAAGLDRINGDIGPDSADRLRTDQEFQRTFDDWITHRREVGKPLGVTAFKQQVKHCLELGRTRALAAIRHSIENGWQGIYEPRKKLPPYRPFDPRVEKPVRDVHRRLATAPDEAEPVPLERGLKRLHGQQP